MVRLYYNYRHANDGLIWSLDCGDITTEINAAEVIVLADMKTAFDQFAKYPNPSGWLYCDNAFFLVDTETMVATIFRCSGSGYL